MNPATMEQLELFRGDTILVRSVLSMKVQMHSHLILR
jgi:hypothetical protein